MEVNLDQLTDGVSLRDILTAVQMVDRLVLHGISGSELAPIALHRTKMISLAESMTGMNYQEIMAVLTAPTAVRED